MTFNLANVSFNASAVFEPDKVTTADLLELCGQMDSQAFYMAVAGLILSVFLMFWYGRIRKHVKNPLILVFVDKFLVTMISMCFVVVLVRLLRAG